MIRIENLSKRFKKLQALDNVSADFSSNQVIALIGPNGSGKTTLIKTILGLVRPQSGSIFVYDQPIDRHHAYRKNIGYMPQIGRYPDNMKIGQLFAMMKDLRPDVQDHDTVLMNDFKLEALFDKRMRTLSGGTRQKVSAALAFFFNPGILILDEPTAGLDPLSSEILKKKILSEKQNHKLVLITSHILSDLDELATHVMYMQEGKKLFLKELSLLREETGEEKLDKAIAWIMRNNQHTTPREPAASLTEKPAHSPAP